MKQHELDEMVTDLTPGDIEPSLPAEVEAAAAMADQVLEAGGPLIHALREEAELKAAIVLARRFPRDEASSYTRIMRACDRPSFAERANYSFPRGGQQVAGPSVDLAREMARIWGNVRYGLRIVTEDDERVHIKGYAYDLETNAYVENEDKFAKLIMRRNRRTGQPDWLKPDERDLRELVNRRGAICVRNAILQLLPSDIIEDAMDRARQTVERAAKGEIQQDRYAAIRRLALAFNEIGVSADMLAGYLKHPLDLITNEEIANLRAVYKSIRDGNSRREEYFTMPAPRRHDQDERNESITQQMLEKIQQRRQQPADPEIERAKAKMEHALQAAQAGQPRSQPEPAQGPTEAGEPAFWEQVAMQAAEFWDTADQQRVLKRLHKAAMAQYKVAFKRLDRHQLEQIQDQVVSGEISLE